MGSKKIRLKFPTKRYLNYIIFHSTSSLRELLVVTRLLNRGSLVAFAVRGVPYLFDEMDVPVMGLLLRP